MNIEDAESECKEYIKRFEDALDDNFNTPKALQVIGSVLDEIRKCIERFNKKVEIHKKA